MAVRLGVSLNAARHHLKELEVEGLVSYQREHRGVGAPVFAYRLSRAGEELFPRRYCDALTAMLDTVVEREGRGAAVTLLESYFRLLAGRIQGQLEGVAPADRLRVVARALSEEGYMAEATPGEGGRGADRAQLRHPRGRGPVPGDLRRRGEVPGGGIERRSRADGTHPERMSRL